MSLGKEVAHIRVSYEKGQLTEENLTQNPFQLFEAWMAEAVEKQVPEANAMSLATVRADGMPSVRVVLLKGFDEQGFVFYTNYGSDKARQLDANPVAALTFYWPQLEKQVRIEGFASRVSPEESEAYYQSRDRGSRLGAWASPQSQVIESRDVLEERVKEVAARFEGQEVFPRPEHWGGFRIRPVYIEFWQGRPSRLHDRFAYVPDGGEWRISRLAP